MLSGEQEDATEVCGTRGCCDNTVLKWMVSLFPLQMPHSLVRALHVVSHNLSQYRYVVKTLDNAESVKLQYRSLAKVPDDLLAKPISTKMPPNWL